MTRFKTHMIYTLGLTPEGTVLVEVAHDDNDGGEQDRYLKFDVSIEELRRFAYEILAEHGAPFVETGTSQIGTITVKYEEAPRVR